MSDKFDDVFFRSAVQYSAPMTKDLKNIMEGLRDKLRRGIADPYNTMSRGAERFSQLSKHNPDQAWLELMFGRKKKEDFWRRLERVSNNKKQKIGDKQYDMSDKHIKDLVSTMNKDKPEKQPTPKPAPQPPSRPKNIKPPRTLKRGPLKAPRQAPTPNYKAPRA